MTIQIGPLGGKLIFWGAVLFLIGLIQGAFVQLFLNSRLALSAHLAAVQSGMVLMILGLVWEMIVLKNKWLTIVYWSNLISLYLIWFSITLAAIFGASKSLPIAGNGFIANRFIETGISVSLYVGSILAILSSSFIVIGLWRFINQGKHR